MPNAPQTVRVSNEIARGETLPSLTKTKGFRALLLWAEADGLAQGKIYEMPIQSMKQLLRNEDGPFLKAELEALAGFKVNWSRIDPDAGGYTIPVSSCKWNKKTGIIRFAFDPQFFEAWQDNKLGFRRITWEVLVSFRSLYAAKIYEYVCVSHEKGKSVRTRKLTTEQLRELLGVPVTAYQGGNAGRFLMEIRRAVEQVNEAQDGLAIAYCRDGRGATARHWFEVEDAPQQKRLQLSNAADAMAAVRVGNTRRARIEAALAELTPERREEVLAGMRSEGYAEVPSDDLNLRIYGSRLRNYGVEA